MNRGPHRPGGTVRRVGWLGPGQVAIRLARPGCSARLSLRTVKLCACLLAVTVLLVALSLAFGDYPIPLPRVLPAVFGLADPKSNFIVQTLRLPESLDAVLAGLALGMSGAIFQSLTGNPLASPDVLGVESGAAVGAVLAIATAGATTIGIDGGAFAGGLAAALAVYLLTYRGGVSGYRLVLIGISIAAALSSVTSFLLTRASVYQASEAEVWLSGSLNGRAFADLYPVGLTLLVILPFTPVMARQLGVLRLGDAAARSLGARTELGRAALFLAGTLLAAGATASAGPVVFVALVAPQLARRMARSSGVPLLPSALVGAALVCAADLAGRWVISPTLLPVGVVTAIVGAPYLLWYLARTTRAV